MDLHPIQLRNLLVDELWIRTLDRHGFQDEFPREFSYTVYRYEMPESGDSIRVEVELNIKPEGDEIDRPFVMRVRVVGEFEVDFERFPREQLEDWAAKNAPIVLYPFVREHAHSLSVKAGYEPVLLPLVIVPTIRVTQQNA